MATRSGASATKTVKPAPASTQNRLAVAPPSSAERKRTGVLGRNLYTKVKTPNRTSRGTSQRQQDRHAAQGCAFEQTLHKPRPAGGGDEGEGGKDERRANQHHAQIVGKTPDERATPRHAPDIVQRVFDFSHQRQYTK